MLLLFYSFFSIATAQAQQANFNVQKELKRYYRCHSIMARMRPRDFDPNIIKIKSKSLSGTDACMKILERANLDSSTGYIAGASESEGSGGNNEARVMAMQQTFKNTLHPFLRTQKCINCHDGSKSIPAHTHQNSETAFNAAYGTGLFSLQSPNSSKIYTKIKNGHQCAGTECSNISQDILASLNNWKTEFDKIAPAEELNRDPAGGEFDDVAQNVLQTFNDFHRSWMGADEKFANQIGCMQETHDVLDSGIVGYYVTKSLFSDKPYSWVVTADEYLKGLRYSPLERSRRSRVSPTYKMSAFRWGHPRNSKGEVDYTNGIYPDYDPPDYVQLGKLVGIQTQDPKIFYKELINNNADVDLFKTEAGALSSPSYVILNNAITTGVSNGGLKNHRRWSRAVLNDFLCRDVPVIRSVDALSYLDTSGESPLPFRHGISCMKCHATMDQMAKVNRNTQMKFATGDRCNVVSTAFLHHHPHTKAEHPNDFDGWVDKNDGQYHLKPNNGVFLFRGYDGKLHNEQVSGFDELGETIAGIDDYYVCAAKRYLHFFTGVDIPLMDMGDMTNAPLNSTEKEYLNFLSNLGKDLKKHQDLKKTIRRIIASEAFVAADGKQVEE